MSAPATGTLYVIAAPSGAGKTSLVQALLERESGIALSVSYTSRLPRPGEVDGRHYHFVPREVFERMVAADAFYEHANVHGDLKGTARTAVEPLLAEGRDVLLEIDWQGARQVRAKCPSCVSIFILPPSLEILEQRLKARSQDEPQAIARRVAAAREEIAHLREYDYVIINKDFKRAALELASIIRAERLKLSRQLARNADLINAMQ